MARAQDDAAAARTAFLVTGVSVWVCWNLGTLAGALLGGGIGDPRTLGLDAMFPAAFLALLAPQLRRPGRAGGGGRGRAASRPRSCRSPRAGVPVIAALAGVVAAACSSASGGPRVSWTALLALAAISYALKALGTGAAPAAGGSPAAARALDLVARPAARGADPHPDPDRRPSVRASTPASRHSASRRCSCGGARRSSSSCSPRQPRRRCCAR